MKANLDSLRRRYAELQSENTILEIECNEREVLLGHMSSALFSLRVGLQAFDRFDVLPLTDTYATLEQQSKELAALADRAEGIGDQHIYMYYYFFIHSLCCLNLFETSLLSPYLSSSLRNNLKLIAGRLYGYCLSLLPLRTYVICSVCLFCNYSLLITFMSIYMLCYVM